MTGLVLAYLAGTSPASDPPPYLEKIAAEVSEDMGISVTLTIQTCDEENAWYFLGEDRVVICRELLVNPLLASAILKHELGHAVQDQLGIPWVDPEVFADEFMCLTATPDELVAAAGWFMRMAVLGGPHSPNDPHPAPMSRAWEALCFADNTEDAACETHKRSVWGHWTRLLVMLP